MICVGIAVAMGGMDYEATAFGIAVRRQSDGSIQIVDHFTLTNDHSDLPTRLFDLAEQTRSRVDGISPDRVVVRRAGRAPRSMKEAPKVRLLAEGAIVSAARSRVTATYLGDGVECGAWRGTSKDEIDQEGRDLLVAHDLRMKFKEAAAAAIAALHHS